jgi:hypothetical protein
MSVIKESAYEQDSMTRIALSALLSTIAFFDIKRIYRPAEHVWGEKRKARGSDDEDNGGNEA